MTPSHLIRFLATAALLLCACGRGPLEPRQPNEPPSAVLLVPPSALVGDEVLLDGTESTDEDGYLVEYRFSTGDGQDDELIITADPTFVHVYTTAGDYVVTLTVVDDRGERDAVAATVAVLP